MTQQPVIHQEFDFAAEVAKVKARMDDTKVQALVLAPSGGGKSSLCGTFGVPTLFLFCSAEWHGPKTADAFSTGPISAMCIDEGRTPDEALDFLNSVLTNKEFLSSYEAIAIDSATKLELLMRESTEFRTRCLTDKGKHNSFGESAALAFMFDELIKKIQLTEKHSVMTLALDVKEMDVETGEIVEAQARVSAYAVADSIIMSHGDVFIIGPMSRNDKTAHRIQFNGKITRTSKDAAGVVKKFLNFTPRLTGCTKLPTTLPPFLSDVLKYKKENK